MHTVQYIYIYMNIYIYIYVYLYMCNIFHLQDCIQYRYCIFTICMHYIYTTYKPHYYIQYIFYSIRISKHGPDQTQHQSRSLLPKNLAIGVDMFNVEVARCSLDAVVPFCEPKYCTVTWTVL